MMSLPSDEESNRVRKTPRRRLTYTVDTEDLVKYPQGVLWTFIMVIKGTHNNIYLCYCYYSHL